MQNRTLERLFSSANISGRRVVWFEETGSTQDHALGLVRSGDAIVIARRQTNGRGRLGRRWESPDGGIWMSVVLGCGVGVSLVPLIPAAAAVCMADAIRVSSGLRTRLKWPNDILVDSKKVAGIIVDAEVSTGGTEYVVVGAGVDFDIAEIGDAVHDTDAASITGYSPNADALVLVETFVDGLVRTIDCLGRGDTGSIIKDWSRLSCTLGTVVSADGVTGTAESLGSDGSLIVQTRDGPRKVYSGDLVLSD